MSLLSFFVTLMVFASVCPVDGAVGVVFVQNSEIDLFSQHFIGISLDRGIASIEFLAGTYADGTYVLSFLGTQSGGLIENSYTITFTHPGTWWIYLTQAGTINNYDYIQIRIVPNSWGPTIDPAYDTNPPVGWRSGYPPSALPLTSAGAGADTSTDTITFPNPIITTTTYKQVSSSTSTTMWVVSHVIGIIMIILVIAICVYKKREKILKPAEIEAMVADKAQQQQEANQVQVACV